MMEFDRLVELVEQGIAALEAGDITEARKLLEETKAELDRQLAWHRLREEPTESYGQLIERLEQARTVLAPSGRTELAQLVRVFTWCRDHGISLAELRVRDNLHKYREAAAYLSEILDGEEDDRPESKVPVMREALACIRDHPSREATRAWARNR
jgi:hypothetical protein